MKRLHIVGKSKDNRRLFLAKTRGAKFGSFEIPISQKLLKLVREVEEARGHDRKGSSPSRDEEAPAAAAPSEEVTTGAGVAATPEPPSAAARPATAAPSPAAPAEGGVEAAGGPPATPAPDEDIDLPVGARPPRREPADADAAAASPPRAPAPPEPAGDRAGPEVEVVEEAVDAGLPGQRFREQLRGRPSARRRRPEIPARSNLSPAEIQTLIRAGRTVRTVAQLAGTSTAWIKWLAEPVEQERRGIVFQALQQRQHRARLGTSAEPLGDAVVHNLRTRGMAAPERIVDEGFSALRDGREWRVRLSYQHRGRRVTAVWGFDPQTKELVALNTLATHLGWREPPSENGLPDERAAPRRSRSRTAAKRTSAKRTAAKRASPKRTAAKRTAAKRTAAKRTAAKRTAAKRTAAKRTSSKRTAAKRTAAARRSSGRSSPGTTSSRRSGARRGSGGRS